MSAEPPGAKPTSRRTGLSTCASAGGAAVASAEQARASVRRDSHGGLLQEMKAALYGRARSSAKVFRCLRRIAHRMDIASWSAIAGLLASRHGARRFAAVAPAAQHVDALSRRRRGREPALARLGPRRADDARHARSSESPRWCCCCRCSARAEDEPRPERRPLAAAAAPRGGVDARHRRAHRRRRRLALGLPFGAAILLGGILAPTDPVLASDVQVAERRRSRPPALLAHRRGRPERRHRVSVRAARPRPARPARPRPTRLALARGRRRLGRRLPASASARCSARWSAASSSICAARTRRRSGSTTSSRSA